MKINIFGSSMMTMLLAMVFCMPLMGQTGFQQGDGPQPETTTIIYDSSEGLLGEDTRYVDETCGLTDTFFVNVVNLELFPINAGLDYTDEFVAFSLPSTHPPMYLEYNMGAFNSGTVQLTEFFPIGNDSTEEDKAKVFQARVAITPNFTVTCQNSTTGEENISWDAQLQGADGKAYPICNHVNTTDIFSCVAIKETGAFCDNPGDCDNDVVSRFGGVFSINCRNCKQGFSLPRTKAENSNFDSNGLNISPNPFVSELTISWATPNQRPDHIELYDLNGRIIYQWRASELEGRSHLQWNSANLPSGVYFIHTTNKQHKSVNKVIKP
ncbi:MAG: T9SS type A sorting domain-containing protein [Bacteroidota bacterium]